VGGYEILRKLSSGGMGSVYLARRRGALGFEKVVAIKTLLPRERDWEAARAMFLDEAQLVARLDHPAIAQVYDFGEDGERLFLAMEYVGGISFEELAQRRPPPLVAARVMAEVCRGLHAAHEATDLRGEPLGVVHRDVSPQNLMLTFDGKVKVLDFGIAYLKSRSAPHTEVGIIKGKPSYMTPEQTRGERVDRRTDVFSACAVLHELLTGARLFTGESLYEVAIKIRDLWVEPPSTTAGVLPAGLDAIVMRGLAKAPDERYPTALGMAEALDAIVARDGGETVQAYADRELAADRQQHRAFLQAVTSSPRAEGEARGRAEEVDPTLIRARALGETTGSLVGRAPGRRRRGVLVAGGLVAVALLSGLWLALRSPPTVPVPPVAVTASAQPAPAGVEVTDPAAPPPASEPVEADGGAKVGPRKARRLRPETKEVESAPAGFGFVTVGADPYALVRIDGEDAGVTPIIKRRLPAGSHEIVLIDPDDERVRLERRIRLLADDHEHVIAPP
jgi:serine/threonine-protein kinase